MINSDKKSIKNTLTTPDDCARACQLVAPYLKQILSKEIDEHRMSKNQGNAIFAAHQKLWKLTLAMKAANMGLDEFNLWLDEFSSWLEATAQGGGELQIKND